MSEMLDKLLPASFKGVPFLVQAADTDIGPKDAEYTYPGSTKQKIKNLGLQPRSFNLTCVIHGTGKDYFDKRDALIRVIEEGGAGLLVHPTQGNFRNYVARRSQMREPIQKALGRLEWVLRFDRDDEKTDPQAVENSLVEIDLNADLTVDSLKSLIADGFSVGSAINLQAAQELLGNFQDSILENTQSIDVVTGSLNSYSALVRDFGSTIVKLINSPIDLADSMVALMSDINGLYSTTDETLRVFSQFFGFGDDSDEINPTTVKRIERRQNQRIINSYTQIMALTQSYRLSAQREYSTTDDVDSQNNDLENQYQSVISFDLPGELLDNMDELRANTSDFLNEERLNAGQVLTVETNETPVSALTYQYYGNTVLTNEIIDLNNITDVSFVSGDVRIVSR